MALYTIRPNTTFTIIQNGTTYRGGEEVDLNEQEFDDHKHKLEGVDRTVVDLSPTENCFPEPWITSVFPSSVVADTSHILEIKGSFFTPDSTNVTIGGVAATSYEFIDSSTIRVGFDSDIGLGEHDLLIDNGSSTILENAVNIFDLPNGVVDLRTGGTPFTAAAVEMRGGMSMVRDVDGVYFEGVNVWASWVRFVGDEDSWIWNRNTKKTLTWIYQNIDHCMLGIGSRANDSVANAQYYRGELLSYNFNGTQIRHLFGNNGTQGIGVTQALTWSKTREDTIKLVFTNNGENGGTFTAYRLPSANVSDWFDVSEQIGQVTITGFGSDEPDIMPFAIPANGDGSRFIGFILEDE